MNPGKLNKLLTFQSKALPDVPDEWANPQEVWANAFQAWAAFERPGSREFPSYQKRYAETNARFVVRYDRRLMVPDASDRYRIFLILDDQSSPIISQTWNISPPYLHENEAFLIIEVSELQ